MLSFDAVLECVMRLIACRMSGKFAWQIAVLQWPFLRPIIPWLELAIGDVHEYAETMNQSSSDDRGRQVAFSMENKSFKAYRESVGDAISWGSAFKDTSWSWLNEEWS
eukprot:s395_g43.t1